MKKKILIAFIVNCIFPNQDYSISAFDHNTEKIQFRINIFEETIKDTSKNYFSLSSYSKFGYSDYPNLGHKTYNLKRNTVLYHQAIDIKAQFKDIKFHNRMIIDNGLIDDSTYIGKTFRGTRGFTEFAYLMYNSDFLDFKIGRDYLHSFLLGREDLLFSDNQNPLNHYLLSLKVNKVIFSWYGAELDWIYAKNLGETIPVRRYISGHRIDFINKKNNYRIGISENILYYSEDFNSVDFTFHNPLILLSGYKSNTFRGGANAILSIDIGIKIFNKYDLFIQKFIDDFQIDSNAEEDNEPPEYGYKIILKSPTKTIGDQLDVIYSIKHERVSPRTFNTSDELKAEKWMYLNKPIGTSIGNNYSLIGFSTLLDYHKSSLIMTYNYLIRGEDTIYDNFNTDYLESSFEGDDSFLNNGDYSTMISNYFQINYSHNFLSKDKHGLDLILNFKFSYLISKNFNFISDNEYNGIDSSYLGLIVEF